MESKEVPEQKNKKTGQRRREKRWNPEEALPDVHQRFLFLLLHPFQVNGTALVYLFTFHFKLVLHYQITSKQDLDKKMFLKNCKGL